MKLLTSQLVEEIQYILHDPDRVAKVVSGLEGATLAGIMEYGCLRWATSLAVPDLPPSVAASELGVALAEVRTPLGLRATGPPKSAVHRAETQPAEFHLVQSETDLLDSEWQEFVFRYDRSTRDAGFSSQVAARLQLALCEMADNAVIHSDTPVEALVGYRVTKNVSQFCVVDVGMGILQSLARCPACGGFHTHNDAIKAALKDGVTSRGAGHGGFGFRRIFKSLASQWGTLRFRSGEGCVTMNGLDLDCDQGVESYPPLLPGFQVAVRCMAKGGQGSGRDL